MKLIRDLLTDHDGCWDTGRVATCTTLLTAIGYQGYNLFWLHNAFDMQAFGVGCAALLAGFGAAAAGDGSAKRNYTEGKQ